MTLYDKDSESAPRELPRGPHRLGRDVVEASQRERMLDAVVQAVADKGYASTTVADVVSRAGVSRKTFYEHFGDKEECFLAAYDEGVEILMSEIRAAGEGAATWHDMMRSRVGAYLSRLVEEPAFARAYLIEVFAAGEAALERRRAVHARFVKFGRELNERARSEFPEMPDVPDEVIVAGFGAINELLSTYVGQGRTSELLELQEPIEYVQTALFSGVPGQRKP
ncbi:MAG: TetR/AcrR family transcriptional regulator [Thermoleophilaceae bacterium]